TGCAAAIAETGTIVLDHGEAQGPRALSLVPDYHLIVVLAGQVAPDVTEALERLDPRRPLTFVSGPSATSDIELSRRGGGNGPRTLEVLVVRCAKRPSRPSTWGRPAGASWPATCGPAPWSWWSCAASPTVPSGSPAPCTGTFSASTATSSTACAA